MAPKSIPMSGWEYRGLWPSFAPCYLLDNKKDTALLSTLLAAGMICERWLNLQPTTTLFTYIQLNQNGRSREGPERMISVHLEKSW